MKLSFKIKLHTNQEEKDALKGVMTLYNKVCNHISKVAFEKKIYRNFELHYLLYHDIVAKYKIPSQFIISALSKVADAYKTEITKSHKENRDISLCKFKHNSAVAYDSRIMSYAKNNVIRIKTLLNKRLKLSADIYDNTKIPFFQGEADLIISKNEYYIIQTLSVPNGIPKQVEDLLGVDLGMVKIATDSDGDYYSGDVIEQKRIKYLKHRQKLQRKNTKSSKRHLKKMSNKEAKFRKDINHCISKKIVQKAERTSRGIALENLKQFFDKTRVRKDQRASRCSWSFKQLRDFISYKAILKGISVELVNPAYTSQMCSACGYVDSANRKSQALFSCTNPDEKVNCTHRENADYNAAKNIRELGLTTLVTNRASVNMPIVSACFAS